MHSLIVLLRIFGGTLVIVRGGKKFMIDESKQKLYQVMQVPYKFTV